MVLVGGATAPICRIVPSGESDVESCVGGMSSIRPYYRLLLELMGGSALSTPDMFI
jgi:hypothetical protein